MVKKMCKETGVGKSGVKRYQIFCRRELTIVQAREVYVTMLYDISGKVQPYLRLLLF